MFTRNNQVTSSSGIVFTVTKSTSSKSDGQSTDSQEEKHKVSSQTSRWSIETSKLRWIHIFNTITRQSKSIQFKNLIQRLINDEIRAEEFINLLPLDSSRRQVALIDLKKVLPYLRHSLMINEMTIKGIRPPARGSVPFADKEVQTEMSVQTEGNVIDLSKVSVQLREEMTDLAKEWKSAPEDLRMKLSSLQSSCNTSQSEFKEYVLRARRLLKDKDDLLRAMETWNEGPCSNLRSRSNNQLLQSECDCLLIEVEAE